MKFHLGRIKSLITRRMRLSELKIYFAHFFKKRNYRTKKVLIFAQGRTGSTLLEELLCSTNHFKGFGEVFGGSGSKILYPYQYISGLAKIHSSENFIFHLKIYHLIKDRGEGRGLNPGSFLNKLQKNGWSIIYLNRKNRLNHYLSNKIAESRTGIRNGYQKRDNRKENFQIHVNLDDLKDSYEERIEFEKSELRALNNLNFIEIIYELDLLNASCHQQTVNKVLDYLKLERNQCATTLVKINQSSQKDIIQNYNEVAIFLKENGMSNFLE